MPLGLSEHRLREELTREVHARPFAHLQPSERVTHIALMTGEGGLEGERAHVAALCQRYGKPPPGDTANFHLVDLGPFRLRWERHTEFSTYAFYAREAAPLRDDGKVDRFAHPVIERVPRDWVQRLPGELLVGLHLELEARDAPRLETDPDSIGELMQIENYAGSAVSGGSAMAWMNFWVGADGFGRALIRDVGLRPRQAGRLVQRLCEVETYRMMALLALPLARRHGGELSRLGERLRGIIDEMTDCARLEDEQRLLGELTDVSAGIERISAETNYRFSAARAYYALVQRRIQELREERIEGFQTIQEFMDRRLSPAMRTCESTQDRLDTLSRRVARAGQLLRTRVDVTLEAQNRDLLESMNRRAKLQLRLQETVEGLSVAAISYYLVSLVKYLAEGGESFGLPLTPNQITALSIPLVVGLIWFGMRRVKRALRRGDRRT
ncbi:unnamed protein product [Symbiodinium necroappetens]|uniref:DUF3422 domain-containing protein n=1 Tax=Symbiodinium necroappetens TaxID=1628268 RepID=A0A812ZCD1_9DINO|nr:unnamed protein product [Symbiodinium necroappetens]